MASMVRPGRSVNIVVTFRTRSGTRARGRREHPPSMTLPVDPTVEDLSPRDILLDLPTDAVFD